jgi:hypothetical protein
MLTLQSPTDATIEPAYLKAIALVRNVEGLLRSAADADGTRGPMRMRIAQALTLGLLDELQALAELAHGESARTHER